MLKPYIQIARLDHWFKNIFILPGTVAALLFYELIPDLTFFYQFIIGVISICLAASANYSINEYLDAPSDRKHPTKKNRPAARGVIKLKGLIVQYLLLVTTSLALASLINPYFLSWTIALLVMGVLYNVKPVRTKDKPYLDIISESINNPIRFMLGWHLIAVNILPPSSILIAYWMGGAFLMTIKRFAEFRSLDSASVAGAYRESFNYYTANKLLILSFFFALFSSFFLAIFLIKYRIEYLICFPFLAILFAWYLHIGLKTDSTSQTPEKLFREKYFIVYCIFLCFIFLLATVIDLPELSVLTEALKY
jgi:decaprenyl-phosphate phosphoribosyltransferase